jgi:long-chain fatty acid transport protein
MKKSILGCAIVATIAGNAQAGGLWANEFGDFAGGRAAAGAAAGVDEAITIAYNPASATLLKGDQLFVSGGAFIPSVKFDVKYSDPRRGFDNGSDAGVFTPTGSSAYVHRFDDSKWSVGAYMGGLAGAGLDYSNNWTGRYQDTSVTLQILTLAPTAAYQLTDKLSVGVAVQAYYAKLNLKLAVPRLDPALEDGRGSINGNDTDVAFNLGAVYALDDRTRFGINYQSELKPNFDGDLKVKVDGREDNVLERQSAVNTKLNMAQYVRASMRHDMNEQWSVNLTIGWDDWSQLGDVFVSTERGTAGVPTKWRDTWHYAWGAEYRMDRRWSFTGGVAYDTNPVDKENRNAQLPVDRQIRYALGTRYQLSDTMTIGGYFNYADLGKARIESAKWGGDYKRNNAPQVMANLNWKF